MEEIDRMEWLLKQYAYSELSESDRAWVHAFVQSEDEYEALRKVNHLLKATVKTDVAPSPEVWREIRALAAPQKTPSIFERWLHYPMPSYAAMIAVICVATLAWIGGASSRQPLLVERISQRVDTVYIPTKPDTIFRSKIVYVNVPIRVQQKDVEPTKPMDQNTLVTRGVTMKEKEELGKLLVSGSN
ncbi:MAG: hypothetical protein K2U26_02180 [Cyclobacteriaceae bacterium]|nr:hypothetical protein [Cyclobacteriaceae bacterium]